MPTTSRPVRIGLTKPNLKGPTQPELKPQWNLMRREVKSTSAQLLRARHRARGRVDADYLEHCIGLRGGMRGVRAPRICLAHR